jgi:hypothetical protein
MNTIPSIFSAGLPAYTVIGGGQRLASTGLCAVLLNRGGRWTRSNCFEELNKAGFDYIVSLECRSENYEIEELAAAFPYVRFILFKEAVNIGQQINIAAAEISSPLFFVLWNDIHFVLTLNAARIAERLIVPPSERAKTSEDEYWYARLCTLPVIQNIKFENLATANAPVLIKNRKESNFDTRRFAPEKEGGPSLYPCDAVGIYDRLRFIKLGGFDPKINTPHWQLLDFGLRSWLWGEEIRITQQIRLCLDGEFKPENGAKDEDYLRFFLKNLSPVIQGGNGARLPLKKLFSRLPHNTSIFSAAGIFSDARKWVASRSSRFVRTLDEVADIW